LASEVSQNPFLLKNRPKYTIESITGTSQNDPFLGKLRRV